MVKKMLLILLIIIIPTAIYAEVYKMRVRVFSMDKGMMINGVILKGLEGKTWDFRYYISDDLKVSAGKVQEGPMIGYVATKIVTGEFTLPYIHSDLLGNVLGGDPVKLDYINTIPEEKDDKIFHKCKIKTIRMIKNGNDELIIKYTFSAKGIQ